MISEKRKKKSTAIIWILGVLLVIFLNNIFTSSEYLQDVPVQAKIGTPVDVGSFAYRINKVDYLKTIGDQYVSQTADGIYLIVNLSLKNQDSKEHTLDNSFFKLEDVNGNTYESSAEGTAALEMSGIETLFLKQCNPNIQKEGYLVFEVPSERDYYLQLSGGFWSGETGFYSHTLAGIIRG